MVGCRWPTGACGIPAAPLVDGDCSGGSGGVWRLCPVIGAFCANVSRTKTSPAANANTTLAIIIGRIALLHKSWDTIPYAIH